MLPKTYNKAFLAVATPCLTLALLAFLLTSVGQTINNSLFVKPLMQLLDDWSLATPPSPALRVIVYDDSSAEVLKTRPSIDEWIKIANHLANLGYKKVIFPEIYEIGDQVPQVSLNPNIEFIAGGAVHSKKIKSVHDLPTGLLDISNSGSIEGVQTGGDILHARSLLAMTTRLGAVNLASDYEAKVGFVVRDSNQKKFIPHISLLATPELRMSGDKLTSNVGVIPVDLAGSIYIEQLNPVVIAKMSIAVRSFFVKGLHEVRDTLPERLQDALRGGTTALFVVDGNTGSAAFVDSYNGLVPSYYALASMVSNVLQQRFLNVFPWSDFIIITAGILLFASGLLVNSVRVSYATAALFLILIPLAAVSFQLFATILPTAQLCLMLITTFFASQVQKRFQNWHEDLSRQRDLELGKVVQSLTLPACMSGKLGAWEFEIAYEPYGPMSGDWVQVYRNLNVDHEICGIIAIGDVVGKGPAAALNTASIASVWSHFSAQWDQGIFDIWNFLSTLNQNIHRTFSGNQMSSISVAVLMRDKVQLINCGSPSWIHISPESSVETVRFRPSNPLGFDETDFTIHTKELILKPGSILLAHTDGVMDGGLARKNFSRNITAAGIPESDTFNYIKREAALAGAKSVLPDDFTMLYLKKTA